MTIGKLDAGAIEFAGSNTPHWVSNVGLSLSSGILKIVDAGGTDLSATNPAWVTLPHSTSGQMISLPATAATHLVEDASGTSDIVGHQWDRTTGVAWSQSMPLYLYAANTTNAAAGLFFFLSLSPRLRTTPATAAEIGYHGNPSTNNGATDAFFLSSSDTTGAAFRSKPAVLIGSVTATMDSSDDWTFDALTVQDGIGQFQEGRVFNMAHSQMGANAITNNYLQSSGTPPVWATPANTLYTYTMSLEGLVHCVFNTTTAGNCTNGVGGNSLFLAYPYQGDASFYHSVEILHPIHLRVTGGTGDGIHFMGITENSSVGQIFNDTGQSGITDDDFSDSGDDFRITFSLKAF